MPETTITLRPWTYGKHSQEGGRPTQEDRCETMEFRTADGQEALFAMVADGIGGRNAGELASQWAKEMIPAHLISQAPTASEISQTLVKAFEDAHARIYNEVIDHPNRAGMGTTCTAVVIVGRRLYLAHVGDSRAYVIRNNRLHQLSIDHTWAEEAIQAGRSPEEIRNHPNRGVIKRYLGINEEVDVDTRYRAFDDNSVRDSAEQPFFLEDGDRIFLCTDGVSDVLADARLLDVLRRAPAAEDKAAIAIVQAAIKANAKDNVTAVVVDLPGGAVVTTRRVSTGAIAGAVALLLMAVTGISAALVLSPPSTSMPPARTAGSPAATAPAALSSLATTTRLALAASATALPATRPLVATLAASFTPVAPADEPTFTPMATFTVEPTFTAAAPVLSRPTSTRQVTTQQAPKDFPVPILDAPPNHDSSNGAVTFKWHFDGKLPEGAGFEVVWWPVDAFADADTTAQGFANPVTTTELTIDLAGTFHDQQRRVNWTVLIVTMQPYMRITQPSKSNHRELIYQPRSSGGNSLCLGPGCK